MRWTFLVIFFLIRTLLYGQEFELTSVNLTTQDGLAGNNVYYALQDKEGYIWFATETGVSRYNGRTFENFFMEDGLGDNEIFRMDQDNQGRIWFSAFNYRLSYYLNGKLFNPSNNELLQQQLGSYYVTFYEAQDSTVFFATKYEVLAIDKFGKSTMVLDRKRGHVSIFGFEEVDGDVWALAGSFEERWQIMDNGKLLDHPIREEIAPGADGYFDFVAKTETNLSQNTHSSIQNYTSEKFGGSVAESGINKSHGYNDGKIWFCTYNGAYRYDLETNEHERFLENRIVTHVLKDRSGGLWFTTLGEGIYYVPSLANKSVRPFQDEPNSSYVSALAKLNGKTWFGGAHNQIGYINKDGLELLKVPPSGKSRSMVKGFEPAGDNDFFMAAEDILMYFKNDRLVYEIKMPTKVLRKIPGLGYTMGLTEGLLTTTKEDLLQFLKQGLWHRMNADEQLATYTNSTLYENEGFVIDVEPFDKGFLYATSSGLGYMNKSMEPIQLPENPILRERINDILVLSDSSFVIASHGYGIHLYENGKWLKISRRDGLSSDICKKVVSVKENEFWIATNSGINQVTVHDGTTSIKSLTKSDGLISEEVYDLLVEDDRLIAATSEGLSIIDLKTLHSENTAPIIYIKDLQVNGQSNLDPDKSIPYNHRNVAFEFDGIHFASLERLRFEYRLLGQDEEWVTTANTAVNFGNLAPGNYTFQLRASSAFGYRSEIKEESFSINLPFWRSWWFILTSVLIFMSTVLWFAQYTIRRNKLKTQRELDIQLRIADAERKALQSQLNPHFIFNSLNSIQSMVLEKEPEEAYSYLEKFSKLIRRVLKFSDLSMIKVDEELETLKLYMDLERLRLENKFEYHVKIDPTIGSQELIPAMILQPYVENAIWHGIIPLEGSRMGKILIRISKDEEGLALEVEDNGIGRDRVETQPGFGTKLADQLAKAFLGPEAGFVEVEDLMADGVPSGTKVNIRILTSALV